MAKAPVPEFNPFRAITPAATLGDFYRQPGMMSLPDTGLGQVADALRGLSPSINEYIGKQADAANQAQMTQGEIDAERLDAEQAREVSRGNFVKLEKDGVIPEGASPFRLAAMQQTVGKKAVEAGLRDVLNQNIQRFSDPFNEEDPAAFVQDQFVEMTQGMGFYAQAAATDALDSVERNFLNRTSLLRAERTVEQNRNDLTSNGYQIFQADYGDSEFPVADMTKSLQESADEHYKNTGESGRDQLLQSVQAAAMAAARDGDIEDAEDYIAAFRDVVIQGKRLGESMDQQLDELSDRADEAAERAGQDQDRKSAANMSKRNNASRTATSWFHVNMDQEDFRAANFNEMKDDIFEKIKEQNPNMSDEEATLAVSGAITGLISIQRGPTGEMTPQAIIEMSRVMNDPSLTKDQAYEALERIQKSGIMSPEDAANYSASIESKFSDRVRINRIRQEVSGTLNALSGNLQANLKEYGVDDTSAIEVVIEYNNEVDNLLRKYASETGNFEEQSDRFYTEIQAIHDRYSSPLRTPDETVSEDAPAILQEAIELKKSENQYDTVPVQLQYDRRAFQRDSRLESNLEEIRNLIKNKSEMTEDEYNKRLRGFTEGIRDQAVEARDMVRSTLNVASGFFDISSYTNQIGELAQAKSVLGFSLEEIKTRTMIHSFGSTKRLLRDAERIELDESTFDPRYSILFPGIRSLAQWDAFVAEEKTKDNNLIEQVYKAMPAQFQTGFSDFLSKQRNRIVIYFPTNTDEAQDSIEQPGD
jgi:hypothetical protein